VVVVKAEDHLKHYGTKRHSGRYPWGSGKDPMQSGSDFLADIESMRKSGLSDTKIAEGLGITTTQLRARKSIALAETKQANILMAQRLKDKGLSNVAIGRQMGRNESYVRSLLAPGEKDKADQLRSIADMLKRQVDEKSYIDIGAGTELALPLSDNPSATIGVAATKFRTAVAMLKEEGYMTHEVLIPQLGTKDMTRVLVLAKPGTTQRDAWMNRHNIALINERSEDHGREGSWIEPRPPLSMSSKRIAIRYGNEGGSDKDGMIEIRPGAKDLDMGSARYAQVRILVDGTHYLKGMAVYNDKLPPGTDIVFNTNKSKSGSKLDVMKEVNRTKEGNVDLENPFGAAIKPGGQRGHLNILREEGDWDQWKNKLPSQMLSKQSPDLIKRQLDRTFERRKQEFDEISSLTNPAVKRKLLKSFSDATDSSSVHLEAANMPHQATKVLLPIPSLKENEVFAPSFENGTRLALVRFPHGGTFEIPDVVVNNKNREARSIMGHNATDAIGIHPKVAERLSGADFDGDHVIAIPNNRGEVKSTPALEGLKGFDPKHSFPPYDGMKTVDGGVWSEKLKKPVYGEEGPRPVFMQRQMGDVSNLITDMTIKGASTPELARAVRHSMVVIDSEKHSLDIKSSARDNNISALKVKYQGSARSGASTLLSKAGAEERVNVRRQRRANEGGPIDPATGKKMFVDTGATYVDRKTGKTVLKTFKTERLAVTDNAHDLSSGTPQEELYADHSNRLKALANTARKEMITVKSIPYSESSKRIYAEEVTSLDRKLTAAKKNAPLERQAQVIGNKVYHQKVRANPDMGDDEKRKIKNQALAEARVRVGAHKDPIEIEGREWEAIQAGAISNHKLEEILDNGKIEQIKQLAMPSTKKLMSPTNTARAKQMLDAGFTQAEVAKQLGVSLTTLKTGLEE
jgi:hypothetical protein